MNTQEFLPANNEDQFFMPIQNTKPYLKLNLHGFAGSGKTYTGALIAIGVYQRINSLKPIVVFDTEESSKFLIPLFAKYNITAVNRRSRSLADLRETIKRCQDGYSDVIIIDSISHVWENFLEAYKKQKNRTRLEFQDWGIIKPTWREEFSDPFVRSPLHIIMTGRTGYEYDTEIDEETKKRTIYKSGVKMKVEGETAYEPDILVYMERFENLLDEGKEIYRQGTIVKDRSTLLDGQVLKNPTYKNFAPAIEALLSNPAESAPPIPGNDANLIKQEEDKRAWIQRKDVALENAEGIIISFFPGQSASEKKHKVDALEYAYGTRSWTAVQKMSPEKIEDGHKKLAEYGEKAKSKGESKTS